jgi:hypothetical protein
MKLLPKIAALLLLINYSTQAQTIKRVVFLGNSYTYVNDLPLIISKLASNTGDSLYYQQSTPGGYTLEGHSTNPTSLALIQQSGWDYMILQEQSQKPSWPISQVMTDVYPYAQSLCNIFKVANPCSKPMFFMTWGRKNGDSYNCANWPPVCTYSGMDSLLNLRYRMLADSNQAIVSPVGAVWHYIRDNFSDIELYSADESHPSLNGSYAAACTFYSLIFQKDPINITNDYGLNPDYATRIRQAAKLIAFDSLLKWNVGVFQNPQPNPQFQYNQLLDTVYFTNNTVNADSFKWYFGDGDSSSVANPRHHYNQAGNYNVKLIATICDNADTITQIISFAVLPDNINEVELIRPIVFPNPVIDNLNIEFERIYNINSINLYSIDGRLVLAKEDVNTNSLSLNLSNLYRGIYFLKFRIKNQNFQYKVVKQ